MSDTSPEASRTDDLVSNGAGSSRKRGVVPELVFLMSVGRGLSAMGLGLLLFFIPDKSSAMLTNMMGFFWLFSGIALLRRSRTDPLLQQAMGYRTALLVSIVGILTGLLVVTRQFTERWVPEATVIVLLGVVILLTGLLHVLAEVHAGGAFSAPHRWLHASLGLFEMILGTMLIISPMDRSNFTYWIAAIWGIVFGVLAIGEAFAQRSAKGSNQALSDSDEATATTA